MESLTSAINFADVVTAVIATGAAVVVVVVAMKGVQMVISALKRA